MSINCFGACQVKQREKCTLLTNQLSAMCPTHDQWSLGNCIGELSFRNERNGRKVTARSVSKWWQEKIITSMSTNIAFPQSFTIAIKCCCRVLTIDDDYFQLDAKWYPFTHKSLAVMTATERNRHFTGKRCTQINQISCGAHCATGRLLIYWLILCLNKLTIYFGGLREYTTAIFIYKPVSGLPFFRSIFASNHCDWVFEDSLSSVTNERS